MIWLVLLYARVKHRRVYVQQANRSYLWSGIVLWVTPWAVALQVSYDDPDTVHTVVIPVAGIEEVRDFSPSASRNDVKDAFRDEPPDGQGVSV